MQPFTLFNVKTSDVLKKIESETNKKVREEIMKQVLKTQLQSEGFSAKEIEDIIQQASEEQLM